MDFEQLKYDLKVLIVEECEKEDVTPDEIEDVDALQISMGLLNKYGVRLGDSKEFRRNVTTIEKLAEYIQKENG